MYSAIKGEMGPIAQMVAKHQLQRKLQKELEKFKKYQMEAQNAKIKRDKMNQKKVNYL